jgi:hypothetical protein
MTAALQSQGGEVVLGDRVVRIRRERGEVGALGFVEAARAMRVDAVIRARASDSPPARRPWHSL